MFRGKHRLRKKESNGECLALPVSALKNNQRGEAIMKRKILLWGASWVLRATSSFSMLISWSAKVMKFLNILDLLFNIAIFLIFKSPNKRFLFS